MTRQSFMAMLLGLYCLLQASTASGDHDGDINIDGTVNVVDLLWAQQTLHGSRALDPAQTLHADVAPLVAGIPAPDGTFNAGDLSVILRIALGDLGLLKPAWPGNQFNIGDSIGEGEAAYNDIGNSNHETVWSTGHDGGDSVASLNERIEAVVAAYYYENNPSRDAVFNRAVSGAVMADFAAQAQGVVTASAQTPTADAGMVTVLLGNNDVCASSMANMTAPALFEAQYRVGLDVLAASDATRHARIHVSGIPAIYWLWNARFSNFFCRVFVWPFVPCGNLLDNPGDDCVHAVSRQDPDTVYPGDGANCQRRKAFHRIVRDDYNTVLRDVLEEYRLAGALPNAAYTDVYDVRFDAVHVNSGDCFHPSVAGHALLAQEEWLRTPWGQP
ncbi:MAG TPA: SGNH/GDSL hydrolase family protein [Gammaproteobacteria bacterium]|nr:SGNH/GDSL hydrolase family protein [Gammaproteobacteria bacterium]